MDEKMRVLHVDDDADFVDVAATFLEREDDSFEVETATSASEGLDRLAEDGFDCVVSDYDMPGMTGIEFLEAVREEYPDLPFVLYTGKGSEEIASDAVSSGVTDYLQKDVGTDQYTVLANRIANAVGAYRTERRLRESEARFREIAELSPDTIFRLDLDGEVTYASPAVESLLGYAPDELIGTDFPQYVADGSRETVVEAYDRVRDGEEVRELTVGLLDADGEPVDVELSATPVRDEGEVALIQGFVRDITDRKERQGTVEQQAALLENSPETFFILDEQGTVTYHNEAPAEVTGYEQRDLLGEAPESYIHPDDRSAVQRDFEYLLENPDETVTTEYRFETPDGEYRWAENRAINMLDDPVIDGILVVNRDVTDRKRRERELEEKNALLSTLVETLPVGILAEDDARRVMAANRQLFELLGFPGSPDEVQGADCERMARDVSDRFLESETFAERIAEVIDAGEPVDGEVIAAEDGTVFERSYRPLELPDGPGHLWVYRDITERTEREQTLERTTRRLEALNRATRDLLAAETREEVAEIGVEVAEEVLGLDLNAIHLHDEERSALAPVAATEAVDDLIGEPPTFTPGDSIAWRTFERGEAIALDDVHDDEDVYDPDSPIHSELQIPIADRGILMGGSPTPAAFDEQDVLLGELLAGTVATALEHVERTEQLRTRERELTRQNDRLEEFASVVSHDLRNPLNVANGRLELAREDCDSDHLDAIERAHDRMATLIEDLLALAREGGTATERTRIDLQAFVEDCWQHVETRDATLVADVPGTVRAEESRLKQLFENLVRNAVEHGSTSPRSSSTHENAGEHGDEAVTVTVGRLADGFYVEDDGPGIPPDERDRVLEAGHSTLEDGTGFGLSIVRQVVEAHGWDVRVAEGSEGGARFEITGVEFVGD